MDLKLFIPQVYKKTVLDIDYDKLKKRKVKCIVFDLNNTLANVRKKEISKNVIELTRKLKKDFKIIVLSNNLDIKVKPICSIIDVEYISFSLKPLPFGINKIKRKYGYKNEELCVVGDQLSDILCGNSAGVMTILVTPLTNKDLEFTKINRRIEDIIYKKLEKKQLLKRGNYYGD